MDGRNLQVWNVWTQIVELGVIFNVIWIHLLDFCEVHVDIIVGLPVYCWYLRQTCKRQDFVYYNAASTKASMASPEERLPTMTGAKNLALNIDR